VLPKIRELKGRFDRNIEVDGGINKNTARLAIEAGANILVAGTAVFGRKDLAAAIRTLRGPERV